MKIPYDLVAPEVERLYRKDASETNEKAIQEKAEFIADYIESCGWKVEEYWEEFIQRELKEYFPDKKSMN